VRATRRPPDLLQAADGGGRFGSLVHRAHNAEDAGLPQAAAEGCEKIGRVTPSVDGHMPAFDKARFFSIRAMRRCILLLCLASLMQSTAAAQVTGRLSGTVEDAGGKALAGARATLTLPESSVVYSSTITSRTGAFLFPALRPVFYDLTVDAPNFTTQTLKNVEVDPAAETSLPPIHLALGHARRVAKAPEQSLETASVDVASTANYDQMGRLPLPGRDPFYLVDMLPGVQHNGRAPLAIYGQSASLANITYDGLIMQESFMRANSLDSTTLSPRTDQISEATVVTGAIYGCGCSQVAFSTPGGGASFHASAYWLAIPKGITAQYWADNSRNMPATTNLSQLGATFGGPLRKDKLFFFLNYEADLDRSTVTRTGDVPGSPLTSRDPLMQQVLGLIPSNPSGKYRGTQNNGGTASIGLARLDYLASARHSFGLTFAFRNSSTDDPSDSSVFGRKPTTTVGVSSPFFAASWRWSPTARLTNEVRAGASLPGIDFRNSLRSRFGFIAILNDPNVSVSQPMSGVDPQGRDDHLHSYQDNLTWTVGKHSLQAGLWLQQYRLQSYGFNNGPLDSLTVPRYVVSDIAEGAITEADQRFNIASPTSGYSSGSTARSKLSANMISGYFHENWRLLRSLTISLGLRFDYLSRADEQTGAAIIPVQSGAASDSVYDQNLAFAFASTGQAFYRKDFDNYSPYTGLAWKPLEKLPLVLRGGFNISYVNDNLLPNLSIFALRNPFQSFDVSTDLGASLVPLSKAPATPAPTLPSSLTLQSLLSFASSFHQQPGAVYAVDRNVRTPNVKYWNVGVESQVRGLQFDVRYVGNRLEEGPRSIDRNQVMMSPGFLAAFRQVQSELKSGNTTSGFPTLPGGGICANFSLQNCQPDLYARSLILTGQAGELARWYQGQGYNRDWAYNFLGNPLAPRGIYLLSQLGVSRYDALQLTVSRRVATGLSLAASYVFSKVLSNLDDYQPGAIDPYLDLHNPSLEWAPSPFNLKHAFRAMATSNLPFFRSGSSASSVSGRVLGGWSISAIAIAQSGAPFSLLSGGSVVTPKGDVVSVSGLGTFASQANAGQNTVVMSLTAGEIRQYFGIRKSPDGTLTYVNAPAGVFEEPAPGALGNLQRRMFAGPGAFNLNLGLRKVIPLTERTRAEFRAESINLLNSVNWLVGDQSYLGTNSQDRTAVFDNNIAQWNSPRTIQFSLRLLF